MALRLEIISGQRQQLGSRASIVLGVTGGTIGRALDNDWALPDTQRFLSGHHARIHFRQGAWFLEDTSTNGILLNDNPRPISRRTQHELHAGDVVIMGEYRILVHVDDSEAPRRVAVKGRPQKATDTVAGIAPMEKAEPEAALPAPEAPAQDAHRDDLMDLDAILTASVKPLKLTKPAVVGDLGESLDLAALMPGVAVATPGAMASAVAAGAPALTPRSDTAAMFVGGTSEEDRLALLRQAARPQLSSVAPLNALQGLQAFCRGAGIDPARLNIGNGLEGMQLAGKLLRETLAGLKEILEAQQAWVERNRVELEAPEGMSPLDVNTDDYIADLLVGHEKRRLDAVLQLRSQFSHAAAHAAATDPAMRQAFARFLGHLAPAQLQGTSDAATSWTRYRELYSQLIDASGEEMPHLFLEALAQAYLAARRK